MFGLNHELAVLFILPHGFKAWGGDSVLDGVYMEAQLQSLGANVCLYLQGAGPTWPIEFCILVNTLLIRVRASYLQSGFSVPTRKSLIYKGIWLW